jgi:hypothetical protein
MEEVQAKVDSGKMKPEEAAAARKEIGNTATVEKSGAIGEGTGMAAGAIAGAKLGAMAGTFIGGPVGTAIGGLAGGALGAFAGSSGGKFVGEKVGSGINAVKGFFGGKTDTPGAATKEALAAPLPTVKEKEANAAVAREEKVSGGPGAKNPVIASTVASDVSALPVVVKKPVDTAAPGAVAAVAMGAAAPAAVKKEAGPNWKATLQDYKSSTPVDSLESQYPGIKAKFIELANNSTPRTDSRQSIETHEEDLQTKALRELTGGKSTVSAKPGSVSPTDAIADPKPSESTAPKANSVAQGIAQSIGAAISPEASTASLGERVKSEATRLGIEPSNGKGVFEGGVLTKVVDQGTGKEHNIEVSEKDKRNLAAAREMRAMNDNSERLAAAASRNLGSDVNRTSTENADMGREAGKGGSNNTVVSNNVSSNNTTKIVPMRANPRPEYTGSSLDRYTNRITVY